MSKRVRKTKKETSNELWEAIRHIEGKDIELTIKNVCEHSGISRQTLYSYPEIKDYVLESKKGGISLAIKQENKKLKETNAELRDYIKQLEKERDLALLAQHNLTEKIKMNKNNNIIMFK